MPSNYDFYVRNAQDFVRRTRDIDCGELYDRILPRLPEGGRILDAGCGSGRDSNVFLERGFRVHAMDASLLHTTWSDLPKTIGHRAGFLQAHGLFFMSFKYGDREKTRGEPVVEKKNGFVHYGIGRSSSLIMRSL